ALSAPRGTAGRTANAGAILAFTAAPNVAFARSCAGRTQKASLARVGAPVSLAAVTRQLASGAAIQIGRPVAASFTESRVSALHWSWARSSADGMVGGVRRA